MARWLDWSSVGWAKVERYHARREETRGEKGPNLPADQQGRAKVFIRHRDRCEETSTLVSKKGGIGKGKVKLLSPGTNPHGDGYQMSK